MNSLQYLHFILWIELNNEQPSIPKRVDLKILRFQILREFWIFDPLQQRLLLRSY
jgi:hypothetical protein